MSSFEGIKRDVRAFADPGSDVLLEGDVLIWRKDGEDRGATLVQAPGEDRPRVQIEGTPAIPYRAFLASPYMADLRRLAEFIPKTVRSLGPYVPTRATRLTDHDEPNSHHASGDDADRLIPGLVGSLPFGSTRILLVQGAPGSGKTMALKRMTSERAKHYLDDEVAALFFYIDVQGRALSRLDDAMARDLQDLRSRFSYSAVPPLVRNGLLIPVIDGFDELLGSGGYDEAFSSLAAFIAQLEGRGAVIASARSTFFDYNAFRQNAERYAHDGLLNYDVRSVQIEPWDENAADTLVGTIGNDDLVSRFRHVRGNLDEPNRALLQKPFYVSQVAKLLASGEGIDSEDTILEILVQKYLEREHSKLLDKDGKPLLRLSAHRRLLVGLAEEMWWLEARQLDLETVRTVVELQLDDLGVPHETARRVVERMPTYAFLATSSGGRFLQFEHEMFYGYFLAAVLKRCMEGEQPDLRRFLTRSLLDETVLDQIVNLYGDDVGAYTRAATSVCDVLGRGLGDAVARQNGGRFVARAIKACGTLGRGVELNNLYFEQDDFGEAILDRPRFRHCHFNGVDLSRLRLVEPEFEECTIQMPRISMEHTRFEAADADLADMVTGIELVNVDNGDETGARRQYAPDQIRALLVRLGMQGRETRTDEAGYSTTQEERIELLERMLHKMETRFYMVDEDLEQLAFTKNPEWTTVYRLLKEHGIVREEFRPMSGPRKPLVRLSYPASVVREGEVGTAGGVKEVREFWRALLSHQG